KTTKKKKGEEPPVIAETEEAGAEPEVIEPGKEIPQPEAPKEEEDNMVRVKFKNLTGPNILGKIELPVEPPKKKPVATSSGYDTERIDKKKKRKRTDRKAGGVAIPQDKRT